MESGEMGLGLLDLIAGFRTLVLVDAVQTGRAAPGFIHEIDAEDLQVAPPIAPHFLGVGEVLALGCQLGMVMPRRVRIFGVEVEDALTVGTRMTPALEAAAATVVKRVLETLATDGGAGRGARLVNLAVLGD